MKKQTVRKSQSKACECALQPHPSKFASVMSSFRDKRPSNLLEPHKIFRLNFDATPQVKTFNSWSPDPWTVVGDNGKNLFTVSGIVLTIIKALTVDGKPTQFFNLAFNLKCDGWVTEHSQPGVYGATYSLGLRLDLSNPAGGLLATYYTGFDGDLRLTMYCTTDDPVYLSKSLDTDIFDAISHAHLAAERQMFWPCY